MNGWDLQAPSWRAGVIALAIVAGATAAGAAEDPLAGLDISAKGVGWQGILVGMSYVQAERRASSTLPLTERPGATCGSFVSGAERGGLFLQIGFSGSRPGDKIETIFVRFEGYQVAASARDLAESLRRKSPNATYRPDPVAPEVGEAEDPAPVFHLEAGKESYAIQLRPRDGILITRGGCLR